MLGTLWLFPLPVFSSWVGAAPAFKGVDTPSLDEPGDTLQELLEKVNPWGTGGFSRVSKDLNRLRAPRKRHSDHGQKRWQTADFLLRPGHVIASAYQRVTQFTRLNRAQGILLATVAGRTVF